MFWQISEDEWPFLSRISQGAILSPILEQQAIAGTQKHREVVKDIAIRICPR
jgi:hypothetical protein